MKTNELPFSAVAPFTSTIRIFSIPTPGTSEMAFFIHGTNKKLNPNSTNGCITLNNNDLDELAPYLAVNTLPIIVLDNESEL